MRLSLLVVALMLPSVAIGESRAAKEEQKRRIVHALDNCDMEMGELIDGAEKSLPLVCDAIPKRPRDRRCLLSVVSIMLESADRNKLGFGALKNSDGCQVGLYMGLVKDKNDEVAAMAMNLLWRGWKVPPDHQTRSAFEANLKRKYPEARLAAARSLLFADLDERRRNAAPRPPPPAVEVLADLVMVGDDDPGVKEYHLDALSLSKEAAEQLLTAERVPARVFPRLVERKQFFENCERLEVISGAARRSALDMKETLDAIDWAAKMMHCDFSKSPLARLDRPGRTMLPGGYSESSGQSVGDFRLVLACKQGMCDQVFLTRLAGRNFYGEAFSEVADSLLLSTKIGRDEAVQLDDDRCRRNGRREPGLFAITKNGPGPILTQVRQAWSVDMSAGKIVPDRVDGVTCSIECPGMACPW